MSLHHILVILESFQTFTSLLDWLWWSLICDPGCDDCNHFGIFKQSGTIYLFGPRQVACGILVPQSGIEPGSLSSESTES